MECRHDANTTVVIENATFYAVPDDNWLNCSRGPLGPLAMGGLAGSSESDHKGLQSSIFAGVSGFANLANARFYFLFISAVLLTDRKTKSISSQSRDLRQALNRRCSGMNQKKPCTFNLQLDHEESMDWGSGIVDVYYRCVPNSITHRKCNSEVRVKEEIGFSRYITCKVFVRQVCENLILLLQFFAIFDVTCVS